MDSILVQAWRGDNPVKNLGEWLIPIILRKLGYATRWMPHEQRSQKDTVWLIIGSELHKIGVSRLLAKCAEVWVWGQGNGHDASWALDMDDPDIAERVTLFGLRGPVTAEQLGVENVPLCDPGFLMPWALPVPPRRRSKILYIPHWEERPDTVAECMARLKLMGADDYVDVFLRESQVIPTIEKIVHAKFVLTSTLHTAILCIAYGVPWALWLPDGSPATNMPNKWTDTFASMNAPPPKRVRTYEEGLAWWESMTWTLPATLPLVDAFPLPVKETP